MVLPILHKSKEEVILMREELEKLQIEITHLRFLIQYHGPLSTIGQELTEELKDKENEYDKKLRRLLMGR